MEFQYEDWLAEVGDFYEAIRDENTRECCLARIIKGICYLGMQTALANPGRHNEVMSTLDDCLCEAQKRVGSKWFVDNFETLSAHMQT